MWMSPMAAIFTGAPRHWALTIVSRCTMRRFGSMNQA